MRHIGKLIGSLGIATLTACTPPSGSGAAPGLTVGTTQQASICGGDLAEQTFRYGLCVCGDLDMAGALRTSSTRPSTGQDGLAGGVGVNGSYRSAGDADIGGSLVVGGEVSPVGAYDIAGELRAGGDVTAVGDIDVGGDAYVQGDLTAIGLHIDGVLHTTEAQSSFFVTAESTVVEPFEVLPPCGCDDDVPVSDFIAQAAADNDNAAAGLGTGDLDAIVGGAEIDLPAGRYFFDEITAVGAFTFVINGPTAIYVDRDLALAGAMRIELADAGAELDLFIGGDIVAAGYLNIGAEERASDVRVYLGGDGDIAMAGALDLAAALWAPNARLVAAGDLEFTGSILVGEIADAGRIVAVYDADLNNAGEGCEDEPIEPIEPAPVDEPQPADPVEPAPVDEPEGCADAFDCPDPQICVEGTCVLVEG